MRGAAAFLVALLLPACGDGEARSGYSGTIEFPDVAVGSLVGGRVERVLRREGERAEAGETLVEIDPREWRSALDEARALAQATERELDLLVRGPRDEEIAAAEAEAKRLELLWKVTAQGSRPEEIEAARERGTLEQLLVTPVSRLGLTLGKILPSVVLGGIATAIVLLAMVYVFGVRIQGSIRLLASLTLLFLFTSLALGLLISVVARSQLQALMLTMLVLLPSVLLSGFMFPRDAMPAPIRAITWAIPATYFIEILRGVILRDASFLELQRFILPLAALGTGIYLFAATRFRKHLA